MSKGRVFRVVIHDKGYDLLNAFHKASARDWAALIGSTGRNPFSVGQRLGELERMALVTDEQRAEMLAGPFGTHLIETVADLVFLARRMEGEREPGTDRPITPETSFDDTPVMETLTAFSEAMVERGRTGGHAEPDPT